jgi:hypothetical protein
MRKKNERKKILKGDRMKTYKLKNINKDLLSKIDERLSLFNFLFLAICAILTYKINDHYAGYLIIVASVFAVGASILKRLRLMYISLKLGGN